MALSTESFGFLRDGIGSLLAAQEIESKLSGFGQKRFYVSSGLGSDTGSFDGLSFEKPLETTKEAFTRTTANRGDQIILMPGHNENIGSTPLDWNVAGVSVLGLGVGEARPRFDYDNAAASINIAANSILVDNITLLPSVTAVLVGIDVETLSLGTVLQNIEVLPGEDGGGVDEFALGIDIKVGCTRTVIRRLKVRQDAAAAGVLAAIRLSGASDDIIIEGCDIDVRGAGAQGCIEGITTLSTRLTISDCRLSSDNEPGIILLGATTGIIQDVDIFSDLATIDAATVATGMAHFRVSYVEVGNESGAVVKTASVDD